MPTNAKVRAVAWRRVRAWTRAEGVGRKLAIALTIAALASVLATYGAITGMPPFGPDPKTVFWLLNLNLVLLLALGFAIVRRLVEVWAERRRGLAGARLHVRLVMLFGAVAVAPAIVMATFSAIFLNVTIEGWFSERARTAVSNSQAVAEAYLHEHQQVIRADIVSMASDLKQDAYTLFGPGATDRLNEALEQEAAIRNLSEAIVFDTRGPVYGRSMFASGLERDPVPILLLDQARRGDVAITTNQQGDRVRALTRLDVLNDTTYLYVGRLVDPRVLAAVQETQGAAAAYATAEGQRAGLQLTFALLFVVLALLLLLAAAWVGLMVATKLVRPISALITASERVRAGDLTTRVEGGASGSDELGTLSRAFNRMTSQLDTQRRELVEANRLLDERRRFTETVLAGVSAGVIGLDREGRINLPNRSATQLLSTNLEQHLGESLGAVVPEMSDLLDLALARPDRAHEAQIKLTRDKRTRTLLARVTAELPEEIDIPDLAAAPEIRGLVMTFDDVTELLAAQRTAAWADVARRIAHEIKNPLTPIQLSAERLKRKYLKEITSDKETFVICTDTIVRQVGDIGRMVDEFSAFARMPAPVMKSEALVDLLREAQFLLRSANPDVAFSLEAPEGLRPVVCDARQIRQAVINLLQNAVDGIQGREARDGVALPPGEIVTRIIQTAKLTTIEIEDNGKGLPTAERERLTEPYVTTRAKGTGLGLAIVKKIMEDHGGYLVLDDRPGGGARVSLVLGGVAPTVTEPEEAITPTQPETRQRAVAHGA